MNRLDNLLERLPPIYNIRPGSVLHQVLSIVATFLAAVDEDMNRLQRAHWIDTAFDREDLARIGALFDAAPAPWEPDHLYRERLKVTVAARLRGAVTRDVLEFVILRILDAAQQALGTRYFDISAQTSPGRLAFHTGPAADPQQPAFVEFPKRRRRNAALASSKGLMRQLGRLTLTNLGLFPVPLQGVLRGVAGRRTSVPVLVNLANGNVLVYVGTLPCGSELSLGVRDGVLTATLGEKDVSNRIFTGKGFEAGARFTPAVPDDTPDPLTLEPGENQLWYFPLALFGEHSLGAGDFGMPSLNLQHGRFTSRADSGSTGSLFDESLFEQPPSLSADLWWDEDSPAAFRMEIPAGVVQRDPGRRDSPDEDRDRLFALLQASVDLLRAAGVDGRVAARSLTSVQRTRDRVRVLPPIVEQESMRVEERLTGWTALFDETSRDGARFA